jgi:multidrug resistance efflux pump
MSGSASVAVGPPMPPDEERDHQQRLRELYADQAEAAVDAIEAKIAGMQESLKTARAEAKRLRAEAKKGGQG